MFNILILQKVNDLKAHTQPTIHIYRPIGFELVRKILTTSKLHAVSSRLGVQTIKLESHQHTMIMVYAFETLL